MLDTLNARMQALMLAVDEALEAGDEATAEALNDELCVVCAQIDALQA